MSSYLARAGLYRTRTRLGASYEGSLSIASVGGLAYGRGWWQSMRVLYSSLMSYIILLLLHVMTRWIFS